MVIKLRLDPDKILIDTYSVFQEFDSSTDNKNLRNVS